jgi:nitrate/TMAO reductase-like tetraheme cytochrome c subunit
MHHGSHERNNNCFNCHNETNLEELQTRDKHQLKLSNSTPLCGSCHGPTYRDWEAGVHGRTGNYWKRTLSEQDRQKLAGLDLKNFGVIDRKDCVNCHNPHSPGFPGRKPAPGPHPLHGGAGVTHPKTKH